MVKGAICSLNNNKGHPTTVLGNSLGMGLDKYNQSQVIIELWMQGLTTHAIKMYSFKHVLRVYCVCVCVCVCEQLHRLQTVECIYYGFRWVTTVDLRSCGV